MWWSYFQTQFTHWGLLYDTHMNNCINVGFPSPSFQFLSAWISINVLVQTVHFIKLFSSLMFISYNLWDAKWRIVFILSGFVIIVARVDIINTRSYVVALLILPYCLSLFALWSKWSRFFLPLFYVSAESANSHSCVWWAVDNVCRYQHVLSFMFAKWISFIWLPLFIPHLALLLLPFSPSLSLARLLAIGLCHV